jgi:hypothetical protein
VSLRPLARTVVAGSLAFALVAAAASGTAFSVNSVQGIAVTAAASGSVDTDPCTGAYDITWTVSSGNIVGIEAVRIPPSTVSDPGLVFCADMPYAILVADRDDVVDEVGTGTFTVLRQVDVEYLVVAGGGGGGNTVGGGGGAGGLLTNVDGTALTLAPGSVTVAVGAAGLGSGSRIERGQNGGDSQLGSIVATGGGGGGSFANFVNAAQRAGSAGGSGGGGSTSGAGGSGTAGQGTGGDGFGWWWRRPDEGRGLRRARWRRCVRCRHRPDPPALSDAVGYPTFPGSG